MAEGLGTLDTLRCHSPGVLPSDSGVLPSERLPEGAVGLAYLEMLVRRVARDELKRLGWAGTGFGVEREGCSNQEGLVERGVVEGMWVAVM